MGKALSGELSCPCDRSCLYKHGDRWAWANSAAPNQTVPEEQSDLGMYCVIPNAASGCLTNLFHFKPLKRQTKIAAADILFF